MGNASTCHVDDGVFVVGRRGWRQHDHVSIIELIVAVGRLIQGEILLLCHIQPIADGCSIGYHGLCSLLVHWSVDWPLSSYCTIPRFAEKGVSDGRMWSEP